MYLPLHDGFPKHYYFKIPMPKLCFFTVSLPLCAFISCVILTMYKDFNEANQTHCNVPNIFPSISASIGNYEPQRTIWSNAIYFHGPFRFFIAYLQWNYFRAVIREDLKVILNVALILTVIENITLIGLTKWTSTVNYSYHEVCFKTFIATSIIYMFIICLLLTKFRRRPISHRLEKLSLKVKKRAFCLNIVSFVCAAYFFLRHNKMCEPYVYSMFGVSEYIVVLSNIYFHMTSAYDLSRLNIYINKYGISIE